MGKKIYRNQTSKQRQQLRRAAQRSGVWASGLGIYYDQRSHFTDLIRMDVVESDKVGVTYRATGPDKSVLIRAKYEESNCPFTGVPFLLILPAGPDLIRSSTTILSLFGLSTEVRGIYQFEIEGRAMDDEPGFKEFSQRTITTADTLNLMEGNIVAKLYRCDDTNDWRVEYKRIGTKLLYNSSLSFFLGHCFDGSS